MLCTLLLVGAGLFVLAYVLLSLSDNPAAKGIVTILDFSWLLSL